MLDLHHRADFVAPVAARIDDMLSGDVALVGVNDPFASRACGQTGDRCVAVDFSPRPARPPGQRLAQLGRIDIAVQRIPQGTEQSVRGDQRMAAAHSSASDHLESNAHALGHGQEVVVAVDMVRG